MPSGLAADFLPHGVAHIEDHGAPSSSRAPGSSKGVAALAWWVVKSVPWYLWAMGALYLYGRHVRGNGKRDERNKSRRPLPASENAPRRPEPPSRDVVYRSGSPLAMPRPSSPNVERRGSYRRYSNSSMPNMEERPRASSGLRNAYTPSRSSLSSPRPPPSIEPLQQEPHAYSTSALPRTNTGASTSALRNAYPSSSAPVVPTVSASRAQQRKRAHDDDESGEADKRSRVDDNGAYDFAQTDDDEPTSMQLDTDRDDEAHEPVAVAALNRGTKRRDAAGDDEVESKRTRTTAPDVSVPGSSRVQQQKAAQGGKKRRASSSGSSRASSPATSPRAEGHQQKKKKARKAAIGTGSVRDKRAIDDTSFDAEVDEDALEFNDDDGVPERNADSDVESGDEREAAAREQEHRSADDGKPAAAGQVKRFRSRRDRSGSDNDDLMGDVEPVYGSSTAASSASSTAPKSGGARNARIGRLLAKKSRPWSSSAMTPQRARGGDRDRKRDVSPTPSNEDVELAAAAESGTPRKPGDEWTSFEGDRYRIDADGTQRRLCELREKRLKFRMPKDSKHPDARATHVVIVERWLTAKEYEQAFEHRKLAWQTTFEEEARQQRMLEDESSAAAAAGPDSPAAGAVASTNEHERSVYFTRGVGTPLRAYRNLGEILARPGSAAAAAAGGASSTSVPASPRASPLLANGRMRLASGAGASSSSSRAGTPRSASRKWSEYEVKKLLEGEEAARAEREKRRLGYLAMGGDLYETEQERTEREEKERKEEQDKKALEPAKIKLADFAVAPKEDGKAKNDDKQLKPAAPALALPAPTSTPTTTKPAAPSFFGAPAASTSTSSVTPAEPKPAAAAAPAFSFGAPAKSDAPAAPAAAPAPSMPLFGAAPSAPATSEKKLEPSKPAFSFGAPAPTAPAPPAAEKKDEAPKPAFSFGAPAAVEKKEEAPKLSFGFGAPAAAAKPVEPAPAAPAPSPFGAPAPSPFGAPAAPSIPTPSFGGFGASSSAAPSASTPALNFGSTSTTKPAAPSFSFGAPAAAPSSSATASAAAPSFSFSAASAPPPAPSPAAASSTGFAFGQAPVASPAASSTSAAGGFNFGAQAPAAAPSSGFAFGSTPASPAVSGTGSAGFNFGAQSPAPASPAGSGTFMFGQGPTSAPGSTNSFAFDAGSAGTGTSGEATPRRLARSRASRR
ncbi:hypothetical protein JCM8208_003833 [Rhodotorula glutinis]